MIHIYIKDNTNYNKGIKLWSIQQQASRDASASPLARAQLHAGDLQARSPS